MTQNKITKREWIVATLIVILLSALAGEMDKQDYPERMNRNAEVRN